MRLGSGRNYAGVSRDEDNLVCEFRYRSKYYIFNLWDLLLEISDTQLKPLYLMVREEKEYTNMFWYLGVSDSKLQIFQNQLKKH